MTLSGQPNIYIMDLKPLYTTASRDLIILTAEVTRLQLTISHFRQAAISSEAPTPLPILEPVPKREEKKTIPADDTLSKLLSKATGVFSQSEIPLRKRIIDPATLKVPKATAPKLVEPKSEKENLDFEKIKRAAAQARGKIFPVREKVDMQTPRLVKWAKRRVITEEAPQISETINSLIINLAASAEDRIQHDTSKSVLEIVSLLHWAIHGKLLTFWET